MDEQDLQRAIAMAVEQDAGARLCGHFIDPMTASAYAARMRAVTPLGRALLVVVVAAIVGLLVGSAGLQIGALIALLLAAGWALAACVNSGQGLTRLYDPERRRRQPSDTGAIADAVARGQADGGANAAAYAGSHPSGH
jgi:hypothetical protein